MTAAAPKRGADGTGRIGAAGETGEAGAAGEAGRAELAAVLWPIDTLGEAVVALARHCGLVSPASSAAVARHAPTSDPAALDRWMAATGETLGVSVEPLTALHREVDSALAVLHPALVQLPAGVVIVIRPHRDRLVCLCHDGVVRRIARQVVVRALQAEHEAPHRARIAELLARTDLPAPARARAELGMLAEFLATTSVMHAWFVRLPPGASFFTQIRSAGLLRLAGGLIASHAAQYFLFLLSWWAIARAVLQGHLASGWLWGWALILLCSIPLLMLSTWFQGKLAVGIGTLLRRRLLAGALELPPAMLSRDGIGRLLGRTIEAESLERLALGGGFLSVLAVLELMFATPVLAAGAGGWFHAGLLVVWLGVAAVLGLRLARARYRWTDTRLALTGLTVEHIVGHRTRLAQELPERWHEREDEALARYLDRSVVLDRRALALLVIVPRGWLLVGLAALTPAFVTGTDIVSLGTGIGGVVLAWLSLTRLSAGVDQLATAHVAWQRVAPLFHAAAGVFPGQPESARAPRGITAPEYLVAPPPKAHEPVLEAVDLSFRHAGRAADVLSGCDLVVRPGDRVLIQGPSGGGKSTLVSLLTGMRLPSNGLLLARGLDMSCLGETGWRSRVSASPQFHENHVLTESFAFNLLMSRAWPPRAQDIEDARAICVELGLGPLLERMPGGMYQMIGETGWQLSHGEQSRLFIARALLQRSDVVILDESLAALDPENMAQALRCLRARAPSLIVVAHP
ncbi:MAG TPA: ABC transporter ATP-binding protein [Kofleriaceae bacterium]